MLAVPDMSPAVTAATVKGLSGVQPRAVHLIGGGEYWLDLNSSQDSLILQSLDGRSITGFPRPLVFEPMEFKITTQ